MQYNVNNLGSRLKLHLNPLNRHLENAEKQPLAHKATLLTIYQRILGFHVTSEKKLKLNILIRNPPEVRVRSGQKSSIRFILKQLDYSPP